MVSTKPLVSVAHLGRLGYLPSLHIQERLARQHLDWLSGHVTHRPGNILVLVEHPAVYTVGKRRGQYSGEEERRLKGLGAEFYSTQRGGLITFHGPGQLVAYPVLNLAHFVKGMKWYISSLEKTLISACAHFGVEATTTEDTGVWVDDRKLAAIGVHARRFITSHGVALNCNTDLTWYQHITPCGIPDKGVTSLSQEAGVIVTVEDAIQPFVDAFAEHFQCDIRWTDSKTKTELIKNTEVS